MTTELKTEAQRPVPASPVDKSASERLSAQAGAVSKDLHAMGSAAKDVAQEKLGDLQDTAAAAYEGGKDNVREATRTLEKFIEEQPLTSVLIAAGVGLFLGRFWMRT